MAFGRFDVKDFGIVMILSLVLVTAISWFLSLYTQIPLIFSGPVFVLFFISTFLIYLFVVARDGKIEKGEVITIVVLAGILILMGVLLKKFIPGIFSILPEQTKSLFSVFG